MDRGLQRLHRAQPLAAGVELRNIRSAQRLRFIPAPARKIFPLSWGFDNEVLLSTVYHSDWPAAEQITGPKGVRGLPSGLDLAAALGSGYARSLLKTDLASYPALGPAIDALEGRAPKSAAQADLYDAWINALAVQWADDATFPRQCAGCALEHEKNSDRPGLLGYAAPCNRAGERENHGGVRRGRL